MKTHGLRIFSQSKRFYRTSTLLNEPVCHRTVEETSTDTRVGYYKRNSYVGTLRTFQLAQHDTRGFPSSKVTLLSSAMSQD